ncbi:MAG: response regulator transcription factor [Chitinophagaceae bacterium]|nr:response regulator transcription factor [Chitinophagaceae bacterium]
MLILIVDNSLQIIERLEEIILEAQNITAIHSAVSYEEAKKLYKENKHDMVLLDIGLPGNESLKLLKEIKKAEGETCIIILFNHIDNRIEEEYKSLGVDFFFDKYYDFEKICGVIDGLSFMNTKKKSGQKKSS